MDINKILEGVNCPCGKNHKCDIEAVYIEKGAISRLTDLCGGYENILVIADENTFSAAGERTLNALSGKVIKKVIFDGKTILIPNEQAIDKVNENIDGIDLIIGIGSGVIQDLSKYVSCFKKIPYMVVATAPSMDGYASDGAAMILGGMKETVKAWLPRVIIADTDVLKNAPMDMIRAGYGDIIGKYSALCDWKLSRVVNDEYFCDYIYDTTYEMIMNTQKNAKGLLKRDEESIRLLFEALVIVGIMMSFAGSSRPASGSEHHLSHFFEIVGILDSKPYFAHGVDVAYSTVITAKIRENLLNTDFPNSVFRLERKDYENKMEKIYKSAAKGCIALQDKVGNYTVDRLGIYKEKESEIKKVLAEMPAGDEIEKILLEAELDISEFYEMYGEEKINTAILYAKDLKDRYTVLWLNYDLKGGLI